MTPHDEVDCIRMASIRICGFISVVVAVLAVIPVVALGSTAGEEFEAKWKACEPPVTRVECKEQLVRDEGSVELCQRLGDQRDLDSDYCLLYLAEHENDPSLCAIPWSETSRNKCYQYFAVLHSDPSFCDRITYQGVEDGCLAMLGGYSDKAKSRPYVGLLAALVAFLGLLLAHTRPRFAIPISFATGALIGGLALLNVHQAPLILLPVTWVMIVTQVSSTSSFDLPSNYWLAGIANLLLYTIVFWLLFSEPRKLAKRIAAATLVVISSGFSALILLYLASFR